VNLAAGQPEDGPVQAIAVVEGLQDRQPGGVPVEGNRVPMRVQEGARQLRVLDVGVVAQAWQRDCGDAQPVSCSRWPRPGGNPTRTSPWPNCSISTCRGPGGSPPAMARIGTSRTCSVTARICSIRRWPQPQRTPGQDRAHRGQAGGDFGAAGAGFLSALGRLVRVGAISMPWPQVAAMRGVAGEPACKRNDLGHQRDAGTCDGHDQQDTHGD